jgi:16S rRNA (cytidine1402-2'-O)-methyltransferase
MVDTRSNIGKLIASVYSTGMGTLYVVGTPIGNLMDITLRALDVLKQVDFVACEDTRRTIKLLTAHGIRKPLLSCRAENEARVASDIAKRLETGQSCAYLTDAGTPAVSDPGSVLVGVVREAGHAVIPIPGPSAPATLLSVAGVGGKSVTFEGFLSPKASRRRDRIAELLEREESFVLYESPFRIVKLLADIADLSPDRVVVIGREMTKVHEELLRGVAGDLRNLLAGRTKIVGEFTVLVSGRKMT